MKVTKQMIDIFKEAWHNNEPGHRVEAGLQAVFNLDKEIRGDRARVNYDEGYEAGFTEGIKRGWDEGFGEGYSQAVDESYQDRAVYVEEL